MIELTHFPIDITKHVMKFRDFLSGSWHYLDDLMENHDWDEDGNFTSDWMQVNWEFLVERELLGKNNHILPLEWNDRITFPNSEMKYKVICKIEDGFELIDWILKSKNYKGEELLIFGFYTKRSVSYGVYPPFDFVDVRPLDKKKIYIVPINRCRFFLDLI